MLRRLQGLIARSADRFNVGDFNGLTEDYVFPLPVHINGTVLLHSRRSMQSDLEIYREQNLSQGFSPSVPVIVAVDLPRNGRFRMWVDWTYPSGPNSKALRTRNIYFCSLDSQWPQIEMVEYLGLAAKGAGPKAIMPSRLTA